MESIVIAAIVIAIIMVVLALGIIWFTCWWRKRKSLEDKDDDGETGLRSSQGETHHLTDKSSFGYASLDEIDETPPDPYADLVARTKFTLEEIEEWHRKFLDQNPDGLMDKTSLESLFLGMFPEGNAANFASNVFRTFDVDKNGKINFKEFMIGIALTYRGTVGEKLEWAFSMYDKDGSGHIDKQEAVDIITGVLEMQNKPNPKKADKLVKEMFTKFKVDDDGGISKEAFLDGCGRDAAYVALLAW